MTVIPGETNDSSRDVISSHRKEPCEWKHSNSSSSVESKGLPIIDISPFLDESSSLEDRQNTAKALDAACTDYGFFYLTGHGIPGSTLDKIVSLASAFFALPLSEKHKIKRYDAGGPEGGDGARGYQGLGENVTGGLQDMQEAVDWYAEWPEDKRVAGVGGAGSVKTLYGRNLWPEQPEILREVYEDYVEQLKAVGRAVVKCMGVALGLGCPRENAGEEEEDEDIFVRKCKDSFWVMRMIGYPPLQSSAFADASLSPSEDEISQFSCGAHTDYGCVTLLLSDSTPHALQVQLRNGNWLYADPLPGAFVVNIGDMMERWTNGLWKSTMHRVIHRGDQYRISVPFFYEPGFDAVVKPLSKCVEKTRRERKETCEKTWEDGEREGKGREEGNQTYGEHLLTKVFRNFYYSKRTDW